MVALAAAARARDPEVGHKGNAWVAVGFMQRQCKREGMVETMRASYLLLRFPECSLPNAKIGKKIENVTAWRKKIDGQTAFTGLIML